MPVAIAHEWGVIAKFGKAETRQYLHGRVKLSVPTADGRGNIFTPHAALILALEHQLWALHLSKLLNRDCHYDGLWMVSWCEPDIDKSPGECVIRWLDKDGDVHFRIWLSDGEHSKAGVVGWAAIMARDPKDILGTAEEGVKQTRFWFGKDVLDVRPEHQIMAQKGQRERIQGYGPEVWGA